MIEPFFKNRFLKIVDVRKKKTVEPTKKQKNFVKQKVAWTTPERRINWQHRVHRSHGLHRLTAIVHDHLEVSYESGEVGKLTFEKVFLKK